MSRRLPPLSTLRSFEAAARLLSFSAAARELSVTPTAVSHQIRALEEWLEVKLFDRTTRSVGLTAAGRRYAPAVQAAIGFIRNTLSGPWLDPQEIEQRLNRPFRLRLL